MALEGAAVEEFRRLWRLGLDIGDRRRLAVRRAFHV